MAEQRFRKGQRVAWLTASGLIVPAQVSRVFPNHVLLRVRRRNRQGDWVWRHRRVRSAQVQDRPEACAQLEEV